MSVIETKTLSALEVYKEKVRNGEIEPTVSKSLKKSGKKIRHPCENLLHGFVCNVWVMRVL